jgi:hypothetical protein
MNVNILKKLISLFRLEINDILSKLSEITNKIFNLIIEKKKLKSIVKLSDNFK